MENLMEIISRFPSWLIIVVVIGFVVEPLVKLFKRMKNRQEAAKGSNMSPNTPLDMAQRVTHDSNPIFPRHNTLRPLNTASLYKDSSRNGNNEDYDGHEEHTVEHNNEYNRR